MHLGHVDAIGQAPLGVPGRYPFGRGERLQRGLGLSSAQLLWPWLQGNDLCIRARQPRPPAGIALSLKACTTVGPMLAPPRPLESTSGQEWGAGLPESLSLPASLCVGLRFSPEQFAELCQANPEAVLELAADGSLILMTPTGSETGARNSALNALLWQALKRSGLPLKLFDSSTGFRLADNFVLSPDAALVALDRWQVLTAEQRRGFAPLCPDLVVELANTSGASPSDEDPRGLTALRRKLAAYQRNGARLGWLLIPAEQAVEIWEPLAVSPVQPRRLEAATHLDAAPHFPGLALDLEQIWAG
jgi:Uma2 family endonuclease